MGVCELNLCGAGQGPVEITLINH